ncbi:MAG: efflux RND transporter periplasmic adaptor subunit [Bacteroidetes bacterium]|nr:efflux RND transporter periplasmic adaptor subunit [Bacteroidota bacterium]
MQNTTKNLGKVCILLIVLLYGCGHPKEQEAADTKALDSLIANANITVVKKMPVTNTLELAGKISMDENRSARIFPLAGGIVVSVAMELGDYVQKGELLATIKSPELINAQKDYKNDEAEVLNQEKNVDAARELYKSGLMSEKEYVLSLNQLQISKNNLQKSRELLEVYKQGSNPDEFNVFAPISGYIIEKNISPNTQFQSNQSESLFSVSDLNEIYADANVYQSDIDKVAVNDSAYITTIAYPGKVFRGTISKVLNVLDPETKTMKVRAKLVNNVLLKPEMFAQMNINYELGKELPAIPRSAMVFDNSLYYVIVKTPSGPEVKKIDIEGSNNNYVFIANGISEGDQIVTKDALLIYNALNN